MAVITTELIIDRIERTIRIDDEPIWQHDYDDDEVFEEEYEVIKEDLFELFSCVFTHEAILDRVVEDDEMDRINHLGALLSTFMQRLAEETADDDCEVNEEDCALILQDSFGWRKVSGAKLIFDATDNEAVFDVIRKGFDRITVHSTSVPRVLYARGYGHDNPTGCGMYLISTRSFLIKDRIV